MTVEGIWQLGVDDNPAVVGGFWTVYRRQDRVEPVRRRPGLEAVRAAAAHDGGDQGRPGLYLAGHLPLVRNGHPRYRPTLVSRWERKDVPARRVLPAAHHPAVAIAEGQ